MNIQTFSDWYDEHKHLPPPKHKPTLTPLNPNFPIADNCMTMLIGATGSGKSLALKEVFKRTNYDILIFVSPTQLFDQTMGDEGIPNVRYIDHTLEPNDGVEKVYKFCMRRNMVKDLVFQYNETDPEDLKERNRLLTELLKLCGMMQRLKDGESMKKLLEEIKDLYNEENRIAVILDDCGYQSNQLTKGDNLPINQLTMIRRHLGCNIHLSVQYFHQVESAIRAQASDIVLTNTVNRKTLDLVFEMPTMTKYTNLFPFPRHFRSFFTEAICKDDYGTICIFFRGILVNWELKNYESIKEIVIEGEVERKNLNNEINARIKQKLHTPELPQGPSSDRE